MTVPSFSIIVPTFERRAVVRAAVAAIGRIEYPGELELIVVVDGSTDGSAAALAALEFPFPLQIVEQPNAGAAAARNRGAALASGEILLFLDDDMICQPDIVGQHLRSYRDGADAVLGAIPLDPLSPPGFLARSVGLWSAERTRLLAAGARLTLFDLLTGQLSVRRSVFEAIGGFDGAFTAGGTFGNEDLDLGVRLLERFDVRFNPAAVSFQRYVVTPRQYMRQWFQAGQADVAFAAKHPECAGELFALHGASQRRVRWLYRPIASLPVVPALLAGVAAALAEATAGAPPLIEKLVARIFFAAREIRYWSGVRAASEARPGRAVLVLCYHAIADLSGDPVLANYGIDPTKFAAQLDRLRRRGFQFISGQDLQDFIERGTALPRRAILLSFDDCYAELIEVARTILRPRGIPALAFAVTGMASGSNEWDQAIGAGRLELLRPDQLRELAALGVEVASHSRNHRELPRLTEDQLVEETLGSAQDLQAIDLPRPRFFAYPYGERDQRSGDAVCSAGFSAAFGLASGRIGRASDRFDLPRVEVLARDGEAKFWLKTRWPKLASALG